jgi:hypothetical protein
MKRLGGSPQRQRLVVWMLGTAVALAYYVFSAIPMPLRTAVGVERPLWGIGSLRPTLKESPSGREWLLVVSREPLPPSGGKPPPPAQPLEELEWPVNADTPRQLAPFRPLGTWQLGEHTLRRVWSWSASGWLDEDHLWVSSEHGWPPGVWILDLGTRRTRRGRWPDVEHLDEESEGDSSIGDEQDNEDADLRSMLSSPLEELPPDFADDWEYDYKLPCGRGVYIVHMLTAAGDPVASYAVSVEPAPRILRLASGARPLALSRDGRTLFFDRGGVLWRLDLRKPLPALLDEVSAPELPDPLAGSTSRARPARARARRGRR